MKNIIIKTLILLMSCCILSSCSANRLLSSWDNSSFRKSSIATVLIIGIAKDETKRRIYEDTFVDSLNSANTKSIASYTSSKQSIEPNEKALREIVQKTGAKTVLITHMVSKNEKDFYQPGTVINGTNRYSTTGLYRYYPFIFNSVFAPGSSSSTTKVVLETNLYDVKTEKLIWTARSESIDPVMTRKYYQQLIDLFLDDLASKNLL